MKTVTKAQKTKRMHLHLDGSEITRQRLLRKMTRAELAAQLGCGEQLIYAIERGRRTSERTMLKLARFFDIPMRKLIVSEGTGK